MLSLNEVQKKYRHDMGRKLDSFEDALPLYHLNARGKALKPVVLTQNEVTALGGVHNGDSMEQPLDDVPQHALMVFVMRRNGKYYLVNTEGFSYARYIAEVQLAPEAV